MTDVEWDENLMRAKEDIAIRIE